MEGTSLGESSTLTERVESRLFVLVKYGVIIFTVACFIYIGYTYGIVTKIADVFGYSQKYIEFKCTIQGGDWQLRKCSLFNICDPTKNAHIQKCSCVEEYYCNK